MRTYDFVVLGGGPAGGAAALELASVASGATVALIGSELHLPYERPPLSKAVLQQASLRQGPLSLFGGRQAFEAAAVALHLGVCAEHVDAASRSIALSSGERMGYGKLLFATGASARRLALAGAELDGVRTLRTFADAVAIAGALTGEVPARRVVVIGGGFIGLEVAATASRLGCDVIVAEMGPRLLGRAVPEAVSEAVLRKFEAEGVRVLLRCGVAALRGDEKVRAVELTDGRCLEADAVVVGIGAVPNDMLALKAGLQVEDGIVSDVEGRTSDPNCFAAGDVARRRAGLPWRPEYFCRTEAWEPALQQGRAVGRAMAGQVPPHVDLPWVWSDMFDWNIQVLGHGELADRCVVRVGQDPNAFTVFQMRGDRLVGAVTVNEGRSMALLKRELPSAALVDAERLSDSGIALRAALRPQFDPAGA
ncbi:NAD(P)/FAD-dependent oxidoreductase [Variovorax sp. YR566]|uniref:NAD(P)/FAD-dependent oxidoreductase n=1 Tax=Variovorax sp. YR566 TaxID=3450237 RepID=UPI003F7E03A6